MASHRAERPGRRRAETVRPRYGRLAVLGASLSVTGIAMLGGVGVLPSVASDDESGDTARDPARDTARDTGPVLAGAESTPTPGASASTPASQPQDQTGLAEQQPEPLATGKTQPVQAAEDPPPPEDSGEGKRVVFDQSDQRVWLVDDDEEVVRTYPVSGSLYDNLDPGTYEVYSRSEDAVGIDDSGTMKYFVRFTQGDNGAAIGFHDIPVDDGALVQTVAQLGTPLSHGCIRQEREDAIALWEFAPIGTEVDVTP